MFSRIKSIFSVKEDLTNPNISIKKDPMEELTKNLSKQNLLFFLEEEERNVRQLYINHPNPIPTDFAGGRLFQIREMKKKIEDSMLRELKK